MRRYCITALALVALAVGAPSPAFADRGDDVDVTPGSAPNAPGVTVEGIHETGQTESAGGSDPISGASVGETYEYVWLWACPGNYPGEADNDCGGAHSCLDPQEGRFMLWARQLTDGQGQQIVGAPWEPQGTDCYPVRPEPPTQAAPQPQVTDAVVLQAVQRLGLPRLTVHVQPADDTLVHFDTVFYTTPPTWARSITLLGHDVDVEATPAGYRWVFGDGTTTSTAGPGAPYPATDITHQYTDAGVSVAPRVDTAYQISYRVDGGAWRTLTDTVPAAGLPAQLRIREAVPVLVGAD